MATAWLSLGANLGDAPGQIERAIAMLADIPGIAPVARSAVLNTPAWGRTDQPDFSNAALEVDTALSPMALLDVCQSIETALGRVRREHWGPRAIDIDVIAYERRILRAVRLTLPHPWAYQRGFVLDPLREIAPEAAEWLVTMGSVGA